MFLNKLYHTCSRSPAMMLLACLLLAAVPAFAATSDNGDKLANNGNYAAAVTAFAHAHEQHPQDAGILAKLARVQLLAGMNKQAVESAKQAVAAAPDKAQYQLLLGDAYSAYVNDVSMFSKLGIAHDIRDAYRKGVELEPDNSRARQSLAMFYLMAPGIAGGSDSKGEAELKKLTALDPVSAYIVHARQATNDKDWKLARQWLGKAVAAAKDEGALLGMAQLLTYRENFVDALKVLQQATVKYPDAPGAWYQIGKLAAQGKIDPAVGAKAVQTYLGMSIDWLHGDPPYCWAQYRLGQILTAQGKAEQAGQAYREALRLNPDFKQAKQALKARKSS